MTRGVEEMTREEAVRRIREFGLHHAIEDLPYSHYTVQAFKMAIEALEKQIPKKPKMPHKYIREWECQRCKSYFAQLNDRPRYCCECGQRIDWSEVE